MNGTNAFSVDLEDYFQVSAFNDHISPDDWDGYTLRVEANVEKLRSLLRDHDVKATFFCLGWIAERFPHMIRELADEGHEIASHGYLHQRVFSLTPEKFAEDILKTKHLLEDLSGAPVIGYRAPSFSICSDCRWAYDKLIEAGYLYSSSVYPIDHDHYGSSSLPRSPFFPRESFLEIPITTLRLFKRNWPIGGGGWFRLYPYFIYSRMISRRNKCDSTPMVFYIHPWELDPKQPKIPNISWRTAFRHYLNLTHVESRLDNLLKQYKWDTFSAVYEEKIPKVGMAL